MRGTSAQHERFPKVKEDLGEDPARWLDVPLVESGPRHTDETQLWMVVDRIRGIDDLAVVRAWLAIERRLDRGPREKIVRLMQQRIDHLEENGERDLPGRSPEELRERAKEHYEAVEPKEDVVYRGPDGEITSRTNGTSARQKLSGTHSQGDSA